jgi:hypothetical protein
MKGDVIVRRVIVEAVGDEPTNPRGENFVQALGTVSDPSSADAAESLFGELEKRGLHMEPLAFGLAVKLKDPAGCSREFRFLRIDRSGRVGWTRRLWSQLMNAGYPAEIASRYWRTISEWIPQSHVDEECELRHASGGGTLRFSIRLLSEVHREQYLKLVQETIDEIRVAARPDTRERR